MGQSRDSLVLRYVRLGRLFRTGWFAFSTDCGMLFVAAISDQAALIKTKDNLMAEQQIRFDDGAATGQTTHLC
jgi:hypothetical protein